jgi:LysR family glycine cleavage system transcriptional activator
MRDPGLRLPLSALRTFEAAARRLSFKEAADELKVSPTSVSNHIRQLEHDWQCRLFVRKTRQVVLTDTGRSLARVVSRAFDDIRAEVEVHISNPRKTVTVAIGPIFGARWLIPRLSRFRQQHPKIDLVLHHGPRITSAEHLATTIAVDWGSGDWTGLEATRLLDIVYLPVVSPSLLKERGGLKTPADLARYPVIHQHDRSEWRAWLKLVGHGGLRFAEETVVVDSNVVTQAALDGQGVALGIFPFIQSEVNAGRLACPFATELHPARSYYLLTRLGAQRTAEVKAVCAWFEAEAAAMAR